MTSKKLQLLLSNAIYSKELWTNKLEKGHDPGQLFVEGDIATIMGVKYKRIEEEQKPAGHPLSDEICEDLSIYPLGEMDDDYSEGVKSDMRSAADWQFEQDVISIDALLWLACSWSGEPFDVVDARIQYYMRMFIEEMRPTQVEDN